MGFFKTQPLTRLQEMDLNLRVLSRRRAKATPAQKLYMALGVDILHLAAMTKRDTRLSDSEPGNRRWMTRRQHELRLRAFARRGQTPPRKFQRNKLAGLFAAVEEMLGEKGA